MAKTEHVFFLLIPLVAALGFLSNPINGVLGVDSSIFAYVARRLGEGAVLYRDVFDQKGPLLYVIDWIGWAPLGVTGIWLLDCLALGLSLILARRLGAGVVALSVFVVLYHFFACGGNMPEHWIVVFSGIAYVLALEALEKRRQCQSRSDWRPSWKLMWGIMGFCLAQVMMLKLNMIAVAAPIGVSVLLQRRNGTMFSSAAWVVGGFLAGFLPFVVWFALRDGLPAWWEVYVAYNAQYAGHGGWCPVFSRAVLPVAVIWGINIWMCCTSASERRHWINLVYLTVCWGLVLMSGGTVRYYGPILPACVLPLTWVFARIRLPVLRFGIVAGCLVALAGLAYMRNRSADATRAVYSELKVVADRVIADKTQVTVLGCDCFVYLSLNATCPIRFPFQGTVSACSQRYDAEILESINNGQSRYLIVPRNLRQPGSERFLLRAMPCVENHYRRIAQTSAYDIFEIRE